MCPDGSELRDWALQRVPYERMAELRAHVLECAPCRIRLSEHAREQLTSSPASSSSDDGVVLRRGHVVGRYVVLDVIGAGAMGVVYTAYDPELDRKLALKLIPAASQAPAAKLHVAREARAMAQVAHPNVVVVYDAGTLGEQIFVAMELVEGNTLGDVLRAGTRDALLALFLDAGAGLSAIHRAGFVHRDFKPDNVLVGRDGRARVADFGLAMLPDARVQSAAVGTRKYMAPEQLRGGGFDARSDQYAFCVALEEAFGQRASTTRMRHVEAVLQRGLAPDPAARFGSMDELLSMLRRDPARRTRRVLAAAFALAGMAVCGALVQRVASKHVRCDGTRLELAGVWDDAKRASIGKLVEQLPAGAARPWMRAAAGLDAYADEWTAQRHATCEARMVAPHADDVPARRDACLDRRRSELRALTELFALPTAGTVARAPMAVAELTSLTRCAHIADGHEAQHDVERGTGLTDELARVRVLTAMGLPKDALARVTRIVDQAQREPAVLPAALLRQGQLEIEIGGSSERTIQTLRRAALLADERHDDETRTEALSTLVFATSELDSSAQFERGVEYGEQAAAALRRIGGDPRLEARLRVNLGVLNMRAEHFDVAQREMERALAILDELPDDQLVQKSVALTALGVLKSDMGHLEDALPDFQRALTIREDVFGADSMEAVVSLMNVGTALEGAGRHREAEERLRRALELHRKFVGTGNRREILILSNLAEVIAAEGRLDEARALLVEDQAIAAKVLPTFDARWLDPLLALGKIDVERGDARSAINSLEQALRAAGPTSGPETLAEPRFWLARALVLANHDLPRANELAHTALDTYAKAGPRREAERRRVSAWIATTWPSSR